MELSNVNIVLLIEIYYTIQARIQRSVKGAFAPPTKMLKIRTLKLGLKTTQHC